MLNLKSLEAAIPVATNFDNRDLKLKPVSGSLLEKLVEVTHRDTDWMRQDGAGFEVDIQHICSRTNEINPGTGLPMHDVLLDEVASTVATAVQNHLYVARTVVSPAIKSLVESLQPAIESLMGSSLLNLEVIPYALPAPLLDPSLVESIMRAKDSRVVSLSGDVRLAKLGEDHQVIEKMLTGSPGLDAAITQWTNTLPGGRLAQLWEEEFTFTGGVSAERDGLLNHTEEQLQRDLLVFLVARRLWDNPPEGVDAPLAVYETYMAGKRDNAAIKLIGALQALDSAEKHGAVVRFFTPQVITVNDRVYRQWLEAGGTNEILFGSIISDRPALNASDLNEGAEKFAGAWGSYLSVSKTAEANKRFDAAMKAVRIEFLAHIESLPPEDLALQDRARVVNYFEEALACTKEEELTDLYGWVMRLMCASRFRHTDAEQILRAVDRIQRENEGIDPREAAAVAAIEYISTWLSCQIAVCGIDA